MASTKETKPESETIHSNQGETSVEASVKDITQEGSSKKENESANSDVCQSTEPVNKALDDNVEPGCGMDKVSEDGAGDVTMSSQSDISDSVPEATGTDKGSSKEENEPAKSDVCQSTEPVNKALDDNVKPGCGMDKVSEDGAGDVTMSSQSDISDSVPEATGTDKESIASVHGEGSKPVESTNQQPDKGQPDDSEKSAPGKSEPVLNQEEPVDTSDADVEMQSQEGVPSSPDAMETMECKENTSETPESESQLPKVQERDSEVAGQVKTNVEKAQKENTQVANKVEEVSVQAAVAGTSGEPQVKQQVISEGMGTADVTDKQEKGDCHVELESPASPEPQSPKVEPSVPGDEGKMGVLDKVKSKPKEEELQFPKTLDDFGFYFNEDGILLNKKTNQPFDFVVKDYRYSQKRYEALGELITEHVYELLEKVPMTKTYIPVNSTEDEPRGFFFMTKDALDNPDKLLIIIHGSGVVRAGQWTRKLIINNSLNHGTQLPYINKARELGYGVIVLNTNQNLVEHGDKKEYIPKSGSPEEHATYVWDEFVSKAKAQHIALVAHSFGGVVVTDLANKFVDDFLKRVFAMAFTDSVHSVRLIRTPEIVMQLFEERGQNWVSSDLDIDEPVPSRQGDAKRVSAGHRQHEWTSYSSIDSVFKFFATKYEDIKDTTNT